MRLKNGCVEVQIRKKGEIIYLASTVHDLEIFGLENQKTLVKQGFLAAASILSPLYGGGSGTRIEHPPKL